MSEYERAKADVENILISYCGACHGPGLGDAASGALGYINDLDLLTAGGYIVPLTSADSRLIQVMRNGSMPPRGSGAEALPAGDLELIARFIDNPRFWFVLLPTDGGVAPAAAVDAGAGDAG
ncbi:MAG: hypothetical protein RL033_5678 [Pseudomonadota bacterium]